MERALTSLYLHHIKTKAEILKTIGEANAVLQTHGYTYSHSRDALDLIIKYVGEIKGNCDHVLHWRRLGKKYTKADNNLSTDHKFAEGVYKIQSGI